MVRRYRLNDAEVSKLALASTTTEIDRERPREQHVDVGKTLLVNPNHVFRIIFNDPA
jgi:hypothetical protein